MLHEKYKKAHDRIKRWKHDPVLFVREVFGVEPDIWQIEFLENYASHNRVGAKAAKGCGKTATLSWCIWHYLLTRSHSKVVCTSITGDNLRDGLWSELSKWQQKSPLLKAAFTWTATRLYSNDHSETWYASARQWSQSADKERQGQALAGLHADNILFVLDEVGGIPDAVMATAEAALANAGTEVNPNAEAKLLICGNPTHLTGPLYRACTKEKSLWKMVEITGDPDDPKRSKRISATWAREQIAKYGRDNTWVLVNVFGKFPPASLNALLGPDDMAAAMARIVDREAYINSPKILGVDVARQGGDSTVIFPRQGKVAFKPRVMKITDSIQIAGQVAMAYNKWGADAIFVDGTGGWGTGVIDQLRSWGYPVIDVQFAGKALNNAYRNKRTEMAMEAANWIKTGGCLPELDELTEEATAITYFHDKDQMAIIEKDQIKEEIGRSPDHFDALGLTFAFPVIKPTRSDAVHMVGGQESRKGEYDPVQAASHQPTSPSGNSLTDYNPLV